MSLAAGGGKSRLLEAVLGLPGLQAQETGWLLGEWQPRLAALSGLLSRRTFLSQAAQAGLRATQLSATWLTGSNVVAGVWIQEPCVEPATQWLLSFRELTSSSITQVVENWKCSKGRY